MTRRTKIIATIGPASDSEPMLKGLMAAGMDVARLGLAHDSLDSALERYRRVRHVAEGFEHPVGVLVDLPGPKVRSGTLPESGVELVEGAVWRLAPGTGPGGDGVIEVDYEALLTDVHPGDPLAFGDGAVTVEVEGVAGDHLVARVVHGGVIRGRPGVHIPSDRLRITTPTPDDLRLADAFVEAGVDMVALSFVRSAHDVRRLGVEPHPRGPLVVAKIETRAAVDNLDGIIEASGGVMVARGDLGAECPIEEVPHLQKRIIPRCIALGRPAITATQMLESMVSAPSPTRAEASDVANAVFDGSSAVMLSGETAIGADPVNAVATMARVADRADQLFDYDGWASRLASLDMTRGEGDAAATDALTMAAWRAATETGASAILCITRSGFTVRSIARFRPEARILGFTTDERAAHQLTLSWGATPCLMEPGPTEQQVPRIIDMAREHGHVRRGELVAVLSGSAFSHGQVTDTLRLVRVP
jgi:pyruvate kinase